MFTSFYKIFYLKLKHRERELVCMIECIVNMLTRKFNIKIDEAIIFYYELCNRRKIEHFINHIEQFKNFDELKKFYLGGN